MIEHVLPHDFIFEFNCEEQLIHDYLEQIKKSDIDWSRTVNSEIDIFISTGYPVPHNIKLFDWLNECNKKIKSMYFQDNIELTICDMWIVKSNMGEISRWHYHPLSIFSGLLYFQDSEIKTEFKIHNQFNIKHHDLFSVAMKESMKEKIVSVTPKKGKLIIWPSYITHRVARNKKPSTRYTLAYNTFINGTLSKYETQKLSLEVKYTN